MAVEIIAEAAQGYEGIPHQAQLIIKGAVRAGADAVKFQIIYADELCTPNYQYYDLFKQLEMDAATWQSMKNQAAEGGLKFYCDISGLRSLAMAKSIGADAIKIHTTDFYNDRLIKQATDSFEKIFLSIGGIEIDELIEWLDRHHIRPSENVCIMYGYQAEPTPIESNNLLRLIELKKRLPLFSFGFQDHSDGGLEQALDLALLALPLGVVAIEKHITLDRLLQIEDYQSALPPDLFDKFVKRVHYYEAALGSSELKLTAIEEKYRYKAMKRLVASRDIQAGERLSYDNVILKRFDTELPPDRFIYQESSVLNKTISCSIKAGTPILKEMVQ